MTLRFLGAVDAGTDAVARNGWAETVREHDPFDLKLRPLGCFPERGRPRFLWAGVDAAPALMALAESLERAARGHGFEPETRAFRPHLTLARARRSGRAKMPESLGLALTAPPFTVSEVILFQTVLHPGGARYTALERYPLGAADLRE